MPPEKLTPIGSAFPPARSMLRSHFVIASASAPIYRRPISSRSGGSVPPTGVKNRV
jgi:hypothetical protein